MENNKTQYVVRNTGNGRLMKDGMTCKVILFESVERAQYVIDDTMRYAFLQRVLGQRREASPTLAKSVL